MKTPSDLSSSERVSFDFALRFDVPAPIAVWRGFASRSKFFQWEKEGLQTYIINGYKSVRPSEFAAFVDARFAPRSVKHAKQNRKEDSP